MKRQTERVSKRKEQTGWISEVTGKKYWLHRDSAQCPALPVNVKVAELDSRKQALVQEIAQPTVETISPE